ncbi:Glycosyltransferase [Azotobacter chroococcum NCIMB 8003]|uniref:Glycosyltransferase n=2 Tax=Azotobacter chroococcum TaxID=353 RepID=A0A0C4WHS8_9GAMM|nr:Glycosyltransferase [Azotobacter chroococcum NCIMB 8003]
MRKSLLKINMHNTQNRKMPSIKASLREVLPSKAIIFHRKAQKFLDLILPEPIFYQRRYFILHGKFCSFKEPRRFSEKIFHRMRYPCPIFSSLADKVSVRDYIEKTVGSQYLVPSYLVCEQVTVKTLETLPESFVMKANHSSGQIKIVTEKHREDLEILAQTANAWLKKDFSRVAREKHYSGIQPKIIFEKALLSNGRPPDDYKFNVFNSKPGKPPFVFIQVMKGRFEKVTQNLFLEDWSVAPFNRIEKKPSPDPHLLDPPKELPEMLDIAKRLAAPFGYLRVDFYLYDGKIYIGELTITPGGGGYRLSPPEWDLILGDRFGWPEKPPPA